MNKPVSIGSNTQHVGLLAAAGVLLQWLSQPPLSLWPLALVAIIPWLLIASRTESISRRDYVMIWLAGVAYWLLTLQGLRHANPAIYAAWILLAVYSAVYGPLFVIASRRLIGWRLPIWIAAPVAWVGLECVRNYFATGISAAMLGHAMADIPVLIQIADIFGTYGVSFVLVSVNAALLSVGLFAMKRLSVSQTGAPVLVAVLLVVSALLYGQYRLAEETTGDLARFALIQLNEQVEYVQDEARSAEIFSHYVSQTIDTLSDCQQPVDAVVWPESMYSGGRMWMIADDTAKAPPGSGLTSQEVKQGVKDNRRYFLQRAADLQRLLASTQSSRQAPHVIGGCGVVHYQDVPKVYSGVLHITEAGDVADWYGKTHLVMCGEYIPIVPWIPLLRSLIPPGMGLTIGPGAKRFHIRNTTVAPNICIETAVERVTVNQMAALRSDGGLPDVIVTVTNDGWFDQSSVIDHHLRCAQLVAVGCRRPILSAANNGPTAWIDSHGRIVQRLSTGSEGAIIAQPKRDTRISTYVLIGDWPARLLAMFCLVALASVSRERWKARRAEKCSGDSR